MYKLLCVVIYRRGSGVPTRDRCPGDEWGGESGTVLGGGQGGKGHVSSWTGVLVWPHEGTFSQHCQPSLPQEMGR